MKSLVLGSMIAVCFVAAVAACDDDDDDKPSGGKTTADGGVTVDSGGGSTGLGPNGGACAAPSSYTYALPLQREADDFLNAYRMVGDQNVFLSTLNAVSSFDIGTKALTTLVARETPFAPFVGPRANDVAIVTAIGEVSTVPRGGGAATVRPKFTIEPFLSPVHVDDMAMEGDLVYALSQDTHQLFTHDVTTGAEKVLATDPHLTSQRFHLGADDVYSTYANDDSDTPPTTVFRVSKAGGALVPLTITGAPSARNYVIGVRGSDLLVYSQEEFTGHVLRVPTAGGAATEVGNLPFLLLVGGIINTYPAEGGTVLSFVDKFFWLADGAAQMTPLFCFDPDSFSGHAATTIGKTLYINVLDDQPRETRRGGIITVPLP